MSQKKQQYCKNNALIQMSQYKIQHSEKRMSTQDLQVKSKGMVGHEYHIFTVGLLQYLYMFSSCFVWSKNKKAMME